MRKLKEGEPVRVLDGATIKEYPVACKLSASGMYALRRPGGMSPCIENRSEIYAMDETPRLVRDLERIQAEVTQSLKMISEVKE